MKRYTVTIPGSCYYTVVVEAETDEEALERACQVLMDDPEMEPDNIDPDYNDAEVLTQEDIPDPNKKE